MKKWFPNIFRYNFCTSNNSKEIIKTQTFHLTNRCLIIVGGSDAHSLLQGIITNDIRELKEFVIENEVVHKIALYTLFLNPKGKIITDAFIVKPKMYVSANKPIYMKDQLWIDVDRQHKKQLKNHLKKYSWKKNVDILDIEDLKSNNQFHPTIFAAFNSVGDLPQQSLGCSMELDDTTGEEGTYGNMVYIDPRGKHFGMRIISNQQSIQMEGFIEKKPFQSYLQMQRLFGILPTKQMLDKLPFQYNFDLLNAISFKKGCFLGQEIISRAYFTGIVRRRVFPFILTTQKLKTPIQIATETVLKNEQGKEIGKILVYSEGRGLALINYIQWIEKDENWPLKFTLPYKGEIVSPLHSKLKAYYLDMKSKQKKLEELDI